MKWFRRSLAQHVRDRGAAALLELAAVAAVWPYIIGPMIGGWTRLDPVFSPVTSAASLLITLVLLVTLRTGLEVMPGQPLALQDIDLPPTADPGKTLSTPSAQRRLQAVATASGLPDREAMKDVIGRHELSSGEATLGLLRFANHSPMVAFDAEGARRVMEVFGRCLKGAAARRSLAQLDEDSFGVWFSEPAPRAVVEEELRSLAYVLSQEISDTSLTVAPDLHIGLARLPTDADNPSALISQALMSATPLKRFAISAKGPELAAGENLATRFAMEQALRRAVREGGLSLRYQPFVDTSIGEVAGAEVLLRWRHPTFGDVSPVHFVPLLEETGLIHEIGLWTLNSACRQLSQWRSAGRPGIRLAINLSAIQLQNPSLKSLVARTVASHGLVPADVELELTETAAMEDRDRTTEVFHELRALGFGIAIDDFGNGHSNLGYLKNLPFTKLKIDREFVSHLDTRAGSQAICKALIELGAGFGISVLAEGVERFEEVAMLRRLGCHVFQGYYFARPLTAEDFTARLADADWLATIGSDVHRERAELQRRMLP